MSGEAFSLPTSLCEEQYFRLLKMWGPSAYGRNMYMAHRGRGQFDEAAAESALGDVIARQESLQSSFHEEAGTLVKHVDIGARVALDRRHVGEALLDAEVAEYIERWIEVDAPPLVRAALLRCGQEDWVFVVVIHHLVFDAGSFASFFADFNAAYRARAAGGAPRLPPLRAAPADFARWQRETLDSQRSALRIYYDEKLARCRPIDDSLRARAGVPATATPGGRVVVPFAFDPAELASMRAACTKSAASLVMFTCAGFAALLKKHSGRSDITFMHLHDLRSQFDMHNRAKKISLEGAIGNFGNSLPFHVAVEDGLPGQELVRRTRAEVVDIMAHSDVPIPYVDERYVRTLPRLFAVGFNYQRQRTAMDLPGVTLARVPRENVESERWRFHQLLECRLIETTALSGYMIFDSGFLSREVVAQLVADYRGILGALAADPTAPLELR